MPTVATAGSVVSQRDRFRLWRATRPFWGCLLAFIGGVEIFAVAWGPLKVMAMQGLPGFLTWSVALAAMACAGVTAFQPHLRSLTGLIVVILGPLSILATNLGGLLVGMIMLIVGGGLMLAWVPPLDLDDAVAFVAAGDRRTVDDPTVVDGPAVPPSSPAADTPVPPADAVGESHPRPDRPDRPDRPAGAKKKSRPAPRTGLAGVLDTMFGTKPSKKRPQGKKRPPQKRPQPGQKRPAAKRPADRPAAPPAADRSASAAERTSTQPGSSEPAQETRTP